MYFAHKQVILFFSSFLCVCVCCSLCHANAFASIQTFQWLCKRQLVCWHSATVKIHSLSLSPPTLSRSLFPLHCLYTCLTTDLSLFVFVCFVSFSSVSSLCLLARTMVQTTIVVETSTIRGIISNERNKKKREKKTSLLNSDVKDVQEAIRLLN